MMEIHSLGGGLPLSIFIVKIKWHFFENAESFSAGGGKNGATEIAFRPNSEMEIISVFFQAQLMESLSVSNMYYIWLNPNFILYILVLVPFSIMLFLHHYDRFRVIPVSNFGDVESSWPYLSVPRVSFRPACRGDMSTQSWPSEM